MSGRVATPTRLVITRDDVVEEVMAAHRRSLGSFHRASRDALAAFVRAPADGIQSAYRAASLAKAISVELIEASVDTIQKTIDAAQMGGAVLQLVMAEMRYARLHPAPERAVEDLFFDSK